MKKLNESQQNPLALRAKKLITDAFFDCLKENPYKKVKISAICRRAGLARSTFYNHYDFVEDIPYVHYVEDWLVKLEELYDDLLAKNASLEEASLASIESVLIYWREHLDEYKLLQTAEMEFVLLKLFHQCTTLYFDKFMGELGDFSNPVIFECIVSQGAISLLSILKIWFDTGMEFSTEEMAEIMSILHPTTTYELLHQRFEQK
jgi:AcrR family transcriptional regulator